MTAQADDIEVLSGALAWLRAGQRVALATVIRTWGSSPRPPGSLLAMNGSGHFVGSVSGGCVEDSLLARYRDGELAGAGSSNSETSASKSSALKPSGSVSAGSTFAGTAPTMVDFGVDRQQATRMGLPCGGRLELLVEELSDPEAIDELLHRLRAGQLVSRRVELSSGEVSLLPAAGGMEFQLSETALVKTFGPGWQLLLIGDGQLARHLASMALQLDYRVTICDPRDGFAPLSPLADVVYSRQMPDDAVLGLSEQARSAIITLAHDPRQDDLGLSAALESQAFYIGALGSNRSAQARRKRLASLGYSEQQIDRIHGPAGLVIGSKRPAEIALSILAEITAIRNGISQQVQKNS
jgi:xanthine dehydrogenase accessory factor